ncbi:MAG: FAD-binding protein [Christensenellales bacterium]|nr:FAD-binding protein [Christensenellales bacterium]
MKQDALTIGSLTVPLYAAQTLVVGCGAAGLNAAVSLYKEGITDVLLVTEGQMRGTSRNTGSDKQTYYKLTTCGDVPDSVRKMAQTLFDGQSMDGDLALVEAAMSLRGFYHLVDIGVPFPCNGAGEYIGYKTDHDPNQRGTSAGPLTSKFMTECLFKELTRYGIPVMDGYQVIELLVEDTPDGKRAHGVLALNLKAMKADERYAVFAADNIVYAVGGEAGMYKTSVYPVSQIGGMGTALRAGAHGKSLTESQYGIASIKFRWNLSGTYQQVLPRYVSTDKDGGDEREFLEGMFSSREALLHAIFLKGYQWPFDPRKTMNEGSSLIDLLVYQETVLKGRRVFLDYRRNPSSAEQNGEFDPSLLVGEAYDYLKSSDGLQATPIERLAHMNPAAIELYRAHKIDLYSEMLEIAVCAQHNNGGLAGNWWWESNVRHLFPVGEVNGSHGVYRPGGSALNSGQAGSARAAQFIAHCYQGEPLSAQDVKSYFGDQIAGCIRYGLDALGAEGEPLDLKRECEMMQERMSRCGANIRSRDGVGDALHENRIQQERFAHPVLSEMKGLKDLYRIRDLLVSQQVYLEAIADYIDHGGTSRGSYLICDKAGQKPLEALPELFRFSLEDKGLGGKIQEMEYHPEGSVACWRDVRPIPADDSWFEKVWRDYREGRYYEQ